MKHFNEYQFKEYLKEHYLNANSYIISHAPDDPIACVYYFLDPWFYTVNDILYSLHTMGYHIGYRNRNFYFINTNSKISTEIKDNDKLLNFCLQTPRTDMIEGDTRNKLILTIMNERTERRTITLGVPTCVNLCTKTIYREINNSTGCIKINTFSTIDRKVFSSFVAGKRKLIFDLRENMGGKINDMITLLELLCKGQQKLFVMGAKDVVHCKKITSAGTDLSDLNEIDFFVSTSTASSAEIFILMLRSMYSGEIYGDKTKGKLIIQDFVDVNGITVAVPLYRFILPKNFCDKPVCLDENSRIIPNKPISYYDKLIKGTDI